MAVSLLRHDRACGDLLSVRSKYTAVSLNVRWELFLVDSISCHILIDNVCMVERSAQISDSIPGGSEYDIFDE